MNKTLIALATSLVVNVILIHYIATNEEECEVSDNTVPVKEFVDCWSNKKPSTAPTGINAEELGESDYCLVIPEDGWDF